MTLPTSFIEDLRGRVADVSTDPDELARTAKDWSWPAKFAEQEGRPALPAAVVRARGDEDVAAAVRLAAAAGVPIVPRGGGSGVMGAAVPHAGGIVIDVSGMDRVVEIDEEAMTATVEAGHNGRAFETLLNERGLSFPHYPASAEWASVGGYVAARGSGVLSSRYGKIEDLLIALRVVTPTGEIIDTVPVPRHAVGPELTQLFVGSEGTLGVITRVTVKLIKLPAHRRFEAVSLPTLEGGVAALRTVMQRGLKPAVIRFYDAEASAGSLSPVVGQPLEGPTALLMFEGEPEVADAEAEATLRIVGEHGGAPLSGDLCATWWERRYDFYHPPHYPSLPAMWGTIDAVAPYGRILDVYHGIRAALAPFEADGMRLRTHFSHWYEWGTMVYPRFVIPDASGFEDPLATYHEIWRAGVEAILAAGGVINDHHGVGSTLSPYLATQLGAAHGTLMQIKRALDPANVMNPGKLGFPVGELTA
ncbi:MAG: FAD-binding oxidoreductase [Solirubrobacteraceae bacterium]